MNKIYLTTLLVVLVGIYSNAQQSYYQYFDGADTSANNSILIQLDTSSANIWQIGRPQKSIFDSASTFPNALVTDTLLNYPDNNSSSFTFSILPWAPWGIIAFQWQQKLDMDLHHDYGSIEYSVDTGHTWTSVFNNPNVYNFYGFQPANFDTLPGGIYAFSGTDSTWRDIWLCFDMSWLSLTDSIYIRFTFYSDSINNNKEGWMIDNLISHFTMVHTVKEEDKKEYVNVYPNPTKDILHIELEKIQEYHIIEEMELLSVDGKSVKKWNDIPVKFWIDTSVYADGLYYLKVKTNLKSETIPVMFNKK